MVRLCDELPYLGINRQNERVCQFAAAGAGVSPAITHSEKGVLVSQFIEAATLTDEDLRNPAVLVRVAATLRKLHDAGEDLTGEMLYFCPSQTVRTYVATSKRIGARLPDDIDVLLQDANALSSHIGEFRPVLCHNDLLAANILDENGQIWLIDWEYAGIGNRWFDLANVSSNCEYSDELEVLLLEAYCGAAAEQTRRELLIFKTVSLLREALWAVIQTVMSKLTFDYHDYADKNFKAYKLTRSRLAL